MIARHIVAAALIAPFLTASAMAQEAPRIDQHVYQGGPKSGVPHATRQITGPAGAFAMVPRKAPHIYRGGPGTGVPHSY